MDLVTVKNGKTFLKNKKIFGGHLTFLYTTDHWELGKKENSYMYSEVNQS